MLTTDKILAHKINGKNLILLTQVASSYFIVFGQIIQGRKGTSYKTIFQKQLSEQEAILAYMQLTGVPATQQLLLGSVELTEKHTSEITSEILLLENPTQEAEETENKELAKPVLSPYFPTKEIFLATQMTCAPNL